MMNSDALFTLVRSTLLDGLTSRSVAADVIQIYQPSGTVGVPSGPTITMQHVMAKRRGSVRREELQPTVEGGDFTHVETQWWETTLQIGAINANAIDNCQAASDILQGDAGLTALAAQRVRPLRVADIRTLQFVNGADQFEAMPNFDLVLVYPQIVAGNTPPAQTIEGVFYDN